MAPRSLTDCEIYVNSADLTAQVNNVGIEGTCDVEDGTNMASEGFKEYAAGLLSFSADLMTWYEAETADSVINGVLGSAGQLLSVGSDDTAGAIAYFGRVGFTSLKRGFTVGKICTLDGNAIGTADEGLIRGSLVLPKITAGSTSNSTGFQLGAVSATQKVYAGIHVFAASGTSPTLDVIVQSDDNSGFTSATSRITFAQKTTTGFEFSELAGAITDDYWRANYTIAGTDPSFTFAVVIGIQ